MSDLFDDSFFEKLNQIKLASNIRLDRGMSGSRKSSAKGSSVEFSDFREYIPGDDIRRVDWNAYARFGKLYVKEFMEEKEANYHIFIDASASMDYGEKKKSDMALRLAAVFSWVVLRQLDRVELLSFRNGRLSPLSPVTGRGSFQRVLSELEELEFGGHTGILDAVRRGSFSGRGITILLSDFLEPEGIDEAVRFLCYKRQEVLMVQILSREELSFAGEGTVELEDAETQGRVRVTLTRQNIRAYQRALEEHQLRLEELCRRYGCTWLEAPSDQELERVVFQVMRNKGIFQ